MKTAQTLLDLQFANLSPQDRDKLTSELYMAHKEVLNFFKAEPKKEFTIMKNGDTRKVKASCTAEILANPANGGWSIVTE